MAQRIHYRGAVQLSLPRGRTGIYTVRSSDGGGLVRVTAPETGMADRPGDYSPDGSRLLFKRAHEEDLGPLMEVSVDGGTPTPVGDSLVEDPGRYSPDGGRILTSSHGHLLVLAADGDSERHRRCRLLPLRCRVVAGRNADGVLPLDLSLPRRRLHVST